MGQKNDDKYKNQAQIMIRKVLLTNAFFQIFLFLYYLGIVVSEGVILNSVNETVLLETSRYLIPALSTSIAAIFSAFICGGIIFLTVYRKCVLNYTNPSAFKQNFTVVKCRWLGIIVILLLVQMAVFLWGIVDLIIEFDIDLRVLMYEQATNLQNTAIADFVCRILYIVVSIMFFIRIANLWGFFLRTRQVEVQNLRCPVKHISTYGHTSTSEQFSDVVLPNLSTVEIDTNNTNGPLDVAEESKRLPLSFEVEPDVMSIETLEEKIKNNKPTGSFTCKVEKNTLDTSIEAVEHFKKQVTSNYFVSVTMIRQF